MKKFIKKFFKQAKKFFYIKKKFLEKRKKNLKKIKISVILFAFLFGVFISNISDMQDFSAKIISEKFVEQTEEKKYLDLGDFLDDIKSGNNKKIENLEYIYEMDFPVLGEVITEKITSVGENIHFYFEATSGNGGSIHEFIYDGKILENGKIIEILEN